MTAPSTQLHMDSEPIQSVLISESTQASEDRALLHLGEQTTTLFVQAIHGAKFRAMAAGCILGSATVSNDGACNNEFAIHYEATIDVAQPVPPTPGMDHDLPTSKLSLRARLLRRNVCCVSVQVQGQIHHMEDAREPTDGLLLRASRSRETIQASPCQNRRGRYSPREKHQIPDQHHQSEVISE